MFKKSIKICGRYPRRFVSLQKLDAFDWTKQEQILLKPVEHVKHLSNKQYRMMVPSFNHWLQVPKEKLEIIREIVDTAVAHSTLMDDVQDHSEFRYGIPSAQRVFGLSLTVNALSHVMLVITKKLMELDHPLAIGIFVNRLTDLHVGQGSDLYWQENNLYPSQDMYIDMVKRKNGSYFIFPVELMQLFSSNKNDVLNFKLASNIGLYVTLVDDYYNLLQPKALKRLSSGNQTIDNIPDSDITEGKITLPVIHAMQFPDVASELIDILKQRTTDPKLKARFIELLKKHGSDEYLKDVMRRTDADIRMQIDQLGGNPSLTALMDEMEY